MPRDQLQFLIKKRYKQISALILFELLVIKTVDPDPDSLESGSTTVKKSTGNDIDLFVVGKTYVWYKYGTLHNVTTALCFKENSLVKLMTEVSDFNI